MPSSSVCEMDEHLTSTNSCFHLRHDQTSSDVCNLEQLLDLEMSQDTIWLKKLLADLSISSEKHLSASGRQNLLRVAELAAKLRLYDVKCDNFFESIEREMCKRDQLNKEVSMRKRQVDIINKKLNTINKKFHQLKSHIQETTVADKSSASSSSSNVSASTSSSTPSSAASSAVAADLNQKQKQYKFLAEKCSKYSTQIAHLRRKLDLNSKNYCHSKLTDRAEHLAQLRKQISEIKTELDTYIEFPSDINMAKVKLEEARRQLELLDQNLSMKIDMSKS